MSDDHDKAQCECRVFAEFIVRSGLPVEPRFVEARRLPELDIRYRVVKTGYMAFELVEICSENLSQP